MTEATETANTIFAVEEDEKATRLDVLLASRTGLSRRAVSRLIDEGEVRVDGSRCRKGGQLVQQGQQVLLGSPALHPRRTPPVAQPELPLAVLYEDADFVVINKEPGCAVHPLRGGERGSVASALVARYPECASASPDACEGGMCHRLDRYTSGALIAARHRIAWETMRAHFGAGRVDKEYLALVVGVAPQDRFEVTQPILPAPGPDRQRRVIAAATPEQVYHPESLDAETQFVVERRGPHHTLLRARATTGRRHQVRAHLAYLGLPLVGDTLYGAPPAGDDFPVGYFLHAARLRFPAASGPIAVEAPLPKDRELLLGRLLLLLVVGLGLGWSATARAEADAKPAGHHDHGAMVHRFEHAEDWVKRFEGPERDAWQRPQEVVAALGPLAGKTVVDLGAGTGYFVPHLARAVGATGKVLALDIEADMVRYLRERIGREKLANVEARQVTVAASGLAPASVDRILAVDVWHHIPERAAYAKKLASALRPDGALYVVDFTLAAEHGPPKAHRLQPAQVMAELTAAGLLAELQKSALPEQYIVVGRRPAAAAAQP